MSNGQSTLLVKKILGYTMCIYTCDRLTGRLTVKLLAHIYTHRASMSLPPPNLWRSQQLGEEMRLLLKSWFDSSNINFIISSSNLEANGTICVYMRDAIRSFLLHF